MNSPNKHENYFLNHSNRMFLHALRLHCEKFCSKENPQELDSHSRSYIENLLQSFLINLINIRVCTHFRAQGEEIETSMMRCLSNVLSESFFPRFRESFSNKPNISSEIARRILDFTSKHPYCSTEFSDSFLLCILRSLCPRVPKEQLVNWVLSNREVKKEMLLHNFKRNIQSHEIRLKLAELFQKADYDIVYQYLARYISKGRYQRLAGMLLSGEWRGEIDFLKNRVHI